MGEFREEVEAIVESRLDVLGKGGRRLDADELESVFGRRALGDGALHYAVSLDGERWALTATALDQAQVDDYGPVTKVTQEVERLQRAGRIVPYHQVMVAPRGSVMLDLVPALEGEQPSSDEAGLAFLQELLDHATVRPLL